MYCPRQVTDALAFCSPQARSSGASAGGHRRFGSATTDSSFGRRLCAAGQKVFRSHVAKNGRAWRAVCIPVQFQPSVPALRGACAEAHISRALLVWQERLGLAQECGCNRNASNSAERGKK
jgi:hypothetical protein